MHCYSGQLVPSKSGFWKNIYIYQFLFNSVAIYKVFKRYVNIFGVYLIKYLIWNINFLFLTQEEIDKIVETTEAVTGNIQSLKNKIQILTSEVEEEEEKVKQVTV